MDWPQCHKLHYVLWSTQSLSVEDKDTKAIHVLLWSVSHKFLQANSDVLLTWHTVVDVWCIHLSISWAVILRCIQSPKLQHHLHLRCRKVMPASVRLGAPQEREPSPENMLAFWQNWFSPLWSQWVLSCVDGTRVMLTSELAYKNMSVLQDIINTFLSYICTNSTYYMWLEIKRLKRAI